MIRKATISDLRELEEHRLGFPMPDVTNQNYIIQIAGEDDGELVGAAFCKITTEVSLILKKDISLRKKARVHGEFFDAIEATLASLGVDDVHIFVMGDDGSYEKILRKAGFVDTNGVPLYGKVRSSTRWQKAQRRTQRVSQNQPRELRRSNSNKDSTAEEHSDPAA